jgi:hypothetical protein
MASGRRPSLKQRLAEAEQHIQEGERQIELQRHAIAERQRDGRDIVLSIYLLGRLEERQRSRVAERDRLLQELSRRTRK